MRYPYDGTFSFNTSFSVQHFEFIILLDTILSYFTQRTVIEVHSYLCMFSFSWHCSMISSFSYSKAVYSSTIFRFDIAWFRTVRLLYKHKHCYSVPSQLLVHRVLVVCWVQGWRHLCKLLYSFLFEQEVSWYNIKFAKSVSKPWIEFLNITTNNKTMTVEVFFSFKNALLYDHLVITDLQMIYFSNTSTIQFILFDSKALQLIDAFFLNHFSIICFKEKTRAVQNRRTSMLSSYQHDLTFLLDIPSLRLPSWTSLQPIRFTVSRNCLTHRTLLLSTLLHSSFSNPLEKSYDIFFGFFSYICNQLGSR